MPNTIKDFKPDKNTGKREGLTGHAKLTTKPSKRKIWGKKGESERVFLTYLNFIKRFKDKINVGQWSSGTRSKQSFGWPS